MKKKNILGALLIAASLAQTASAVPAYPGTLKVKQADGTEITIRLRGDEWAHYTTTADGYPIVFNSTTKNYEYATVANGKLVSSNIKAADDGKRDTKAIEFLSAIDKTEVAKMALNEKSATTVKGVRKSSSPRKELMKDFPHFGEVHSPVILVEFNDRSFSTMSDPKQYYTDALNKEGFTASNGADGSARDFFIASSKGQFEPTFDVYGPVKIDYSQYAFGDGTESGKLNGSDMVRAAVTALDGEIDFSQYDHDGDGYVDNIYFYYAGYGAADSGISNVIWPHAFSMQEWGTYLKTNDGVSVDSYTCSNEINGQVAPAQTTGIGTFIHEFGHCLGFMDHYDVDNNYASYAPGEWDTMASGSYNNNSNTPPLYSAYECYELGWLQPDELTFYTKGTQTLPPLSKESKAYKVGVSGNPNEYFILENRKREGWDRYLPGEGMLVWHIDYDATAWKLNELNNNASHQRVDIVEAGSTLSGGWSNLGSVPFPGSNNVTERNFKAWDGNTAIYLDKITKDGDDVSFILKGSEDGLQAVGELEMTDVTYKSAKCSWQPVEKATEYVIDVVKVTASASGADQEAPLEGYQNIKQTATSISLDGLEPDTSYRIFVTSSNGTFYQSPIAAKTFSTEPLPFNLRQVDGVAVTATETNSFTASWTALDDAQSYKATVSKNTYDGAASSVSYDFTEQRAGLPDEWSTTANNFGTASGFYGAASPSLLMAQNNQYIILQNKDACISNIKFWMRAQQPGTGSALCIEVVDGDTWKEVDELQLSSANGQMYSFDIEPASAVRLRFSRKRGNVYLDDITVSGNSKNSAPLAAYTGKELGNVTEYTFDKLEPKTEYEFTITALSNGMESLASEPAIATTQPTTDGISNIETSNANQQRSFYTIGGSLLKAEPQTEGVFIIKENGKAKKELRMKK